MDFEFVISGKSRWEYLIVTIRNRKFEFRKGFKDGNDGFIGKKTKISGIDLIPFIL